MQNSEFRHKKLIAAGVIERNGKILIAQRAKKDALCGKWEFPGGKVEPGETLQECLKRELFEELGIDARVGEYVCTTTFYHKDVLFDMCVFKVSSFIGEITLNEHSAIAWVTAAELSNYEMPEPDLPIIELLQKNQSLSPPNKLWTWMRTGALLVLISGLVISLRGNPISVKIPINFYLGHPWRNILN